MAYVLEAVIGLEPVIRSSSAALRPADSVVLGAGLALVPLIPELIKKLRTGFKSEFAAQSSYFGGLAPEDDDFEGAIDRFEKVVPLVTPWCECASHQGAIACVTAEYWAGRGGQAAMVWLGGHIILGPIVGDMAINEALRHLGVVVTKAGDGFDTVGLARHRATEEWLDDAG